MGQLNLKRKECKACGFLIEPTRKPQSVYCVVCADERKNWPVYVATWRANHPEQYRHQNNLHVQKHRDREAAANQDAICPNTGTLNPGLLLPLISFFPSEQDGSDWQDWGTHSTLLTYLNILIALLRLYSSWRRPKPHISQAAPKKRSCRKKSKRKKRIA